MPRLGVTREADRLTALFQKAEQKGVEIIPLPLTKIVPLSFELPDNISIDKIDWLLFTSANGVESFFSHSTKMNWTISPNTKIAAIGNKTKEAVESNGYKVDFTPSSAYGKNLFEEFITSQDLKSQTVLYARAEQVINDPKELFVDTGCYYHAVVCYRTDENNCDGNTVQQFTDKDYLFFTAPSSVVSYQHQFGTPKAKLIAIGKTTADAIEKENWKLSILLDKPDIEKVLEYI